MADWDLWFKCTSCVVTVIGKVSTLVGATVTITDGVAPKTAVFDSSLVVSFEVNGATKYTVSAGGFSKVITPAKGAYVEVELGAFDRLWLFNKDKRYNNLNGYFQASNDGIVAHPRLESERITYGDLLWLPGYACWNNKPTDFTNYNTLWIKPALEQLVTSGSAIFHIASVKASAPSNSVKHLLFTFTRPDKDGYYPIDISNLSGLHYFRCEGTENGSSNNTIGLSEMFLSKDRVNPLISRVTVFGVVSNFSDGTITASSSNNVATQTAGYGIFAQDNYTGNSYYVNNLWISGANAVTAWVKVVFNNAKKANLWRFDQNYLYIGATLKLYGSNDDVNYTFLAEMTGLTSAKNGRIVAFKNDVAYKYYKVECLDRISAYYSMTGMQLYEYDNIEKVYNDLN